LRSTSSAALAVAVVAATALIWRTPQPPPSPGGEPKLPVVDTPGSLPDGAAYSPQYYVDASTSVGTAPSPDRRSVRLVLWSGTGSPRELRSLPAGGSPEYGGFTRSGDDLAWAESTEDPDGVATTRIWTANLRDTRPARQLAADTGDAIFFNSQYDLVAAGGRVYWAAAGRSARQVTEVRSVPLAGGPVSVREMPGAYALSAWPWLVSAGTGQSGPVELSNLDTGRVVRVPAAPTELVTCSPAWCRVLVLSSNSAPSQLDLMRPDGSSRQRIAGGSVSSAVSDVAVLDRFEVLSRPPTNGSASTSQDLLLYDLARKRTVLVASGAGTILCRAGFLTWSTDSDHTWHTLDLRRA
jgi:hypothetical protein